MEALSDVSTDIVESAGLSFTDDDVNKVKLFKLIFKGRDDVYSINKGLCVMQPLTGTVILRHLRGEHRLSIHPLLPDGKTYLAVVNIEELDLEAAQSYLDAAKAYDIPTYPEISKSNGLHLWTFFNEPVLVRKAQEITKQILQCAALPETTEIFPRHEDLSTPAGVDNCINAPLFGEDMRNGRTVFLDEKLEPYDDQWEFLASIEKITPDGARKKIVLQRTTEQPATVAKRQKGTGFYKVPGKMHIQESELNAKRKRWRGKLGIDPNNTIAKKRLTVVGKQPARIQFRLLLFPAVTVILLVVLLVTNLVLLDRIGNLGTQLTTAATDRGFRQYQSITAAKGSDLQHAEVLISPKLGTDSQVTEAYNKALAACRSGRYNEAIGMFEHVLEYPSSHQLKDNAQYWLAECHYAQGRYVQALSEFRKVKEYFPEGNKVSDAELKIAYTYHKLGLIEEAKQKLLQLSKDWPNQQFLPQVVALLKE